MPEMPWDTLTPAAERIMRERYDGRTQTINELMQVLGVSRARIHTWAARLHLCKARAHDWTAEEDAYLEEFGPRLPYHRLATYLHRTPGAVKRRLEVLQGGKVREGYTINSLARALGVSERLIESWRDKGWLRMRRRQSNRPADFWLITDDDLVVFLLKHGEHVRVYWDEIRWNWLLSVLRSGRRTLRTLKLEDEEAS